MKFEISSSFQIGLFPAILYGIMLTRLVERLAKSINGENRRYEGVKDGVER